MSLAEETRSGSRLALARLLTQVENGSTAGRQALNELFPFTGQAHIIGVTGAPGTGKSSLVNALARWLRQEFPLNKVGIIAVDPSSPFSGGAILGDRVRMRELVGDPGVFIRSMATRGHLGGLASATAAMSQVLDAAGYHTILIETVGAGQSEVDIARLAHTTLVIEAPGMGDDIQAIKAGIMEIADILVVNKSDHPGAEATERALRANLQLAHPAHHTYRVDLNLDAFLHAIPLKDEALTWDPPIRLTVATKYTGIAELAGSIRQHYEYLHASGEWRQRQAARLFSEVQIRLQEALFERLKDNLPTDLVNDVLQQVLGRSLSPWGAVEQLMGFEDARASRG